jgi:galactokinase
MLIKNIEDKFIQIFHQNPALLVRSSGRINLIGEHTDYNGGFVLPAAIDKAVFLAISARTDKFCHFFAYDLNEHFTTHLDHLQKTNVHTWANYLMGVLTVIQKTAKNSELLRGVNIVFGADLPSGGGLSSSAAIENSVGFGMNELFNLGFSRLDLVHISQQAENEFVGIKCGIMDMFASMMGIENQVVMIDCNDLSYQYFPIDAPHLRFVLCDTTVKHTLVNSEYNTRRAECEEGVKYLQQFDPSIKLLRDVSTTFLETHKKALRPIIYNRCKYIVEEILRVRKACESLQNQDFTLLGKLMYETHEGLSKDYEVSCPELDFLVAQARVTEGVLGARMMGGGFGGCTINLVKTENITSFIEKISIAYQNNFCKKMLYYIVKASNGTEKINF